MARDSTQGRGLNTDDIDSLIRLLGEYSAKLRGTVDEIRVLQRRRILYLCGAYVTVIVGIAVVLVLVQWLGHPLSMLSVIVEVLAGVGMGALLVPVLILSAADYRRVRRLRRDRDVGAKQLEGLVRPASQLKELGGTARWGQDVELELRLNEAEGILLDADAHDDPYALSKDDSLSVLNPLRHTTSP